MLTGRGSSYVRKYVQVKQYDGSKTLSESLPKYDHLGLRQESELSTYGL